jgi:uracil phosphoribosyltransferase
MLKNAIEGLTSIQRLVARELQAQFNIEFAEYWIFSEDDLYNVTPFENFVHVSESQQVGDAGAKLTEIANFEPSKLGTDDRQAYLEALLTIYRNLTQPPISELHDEHILFVGIEREGRMLAEALSWMPASHSVRVNAKRMKAGDHLFVGIHGPQFGQTFTEAVIVDGAIASGATLMAVMSTLGFKKVRIFSAHATAEGLSNISAFALEKDIDLTISVGIVSGRLSKEFYATEDGGRVVVGDLGDMIAPIFN